MKKSCLWYHIADQSVTNCNVSTRKQKEILMTLGYVKSFNVWQNPLQIKIKKKKERKWKVQMGENW